MLNACCFFDEFRNLEVFICKTILFQGIYFLRSENMLRLGVRCFVLYTSGGPLKGTCTKPAAFL